MYEKGNTVEMTLPPRACGGRTVSAIEGTYVSIKSAEAGA